MWLKCFCFPFLLRCVYTRSRGSLYRCSAIAFRGRGAARRKEGRWTFHFIGCKIASHSPLRCTCGCLFSATRARRTVRGRGVCGEVCGLPRPLGCEASRGPSSQQDPDTVRLSAVTPFDRRCGWYTSQKSRVRFALPLNIGIVTWRVVFRPLRLPRCR